MPDPASPGLFLAILLIFFFGAFVQGLTGFGFGVVAMSLLPLFLPVKTATPYVTALNTVLCVQLFWTLRRYIHWRESIPLMVGMLAGIPLGVYCLMQFPDSGLKRLLGAYLIGIAVNGFIVQNRKDPSVEDSFGWAFPFFSGVASGGLGGAFNIGGPPAIAFVYRQPWPQIEMNATLQAFFLVSCCVRLGAYGYRGLIGVESAGLFLPALPFLILGGILGHRLVDRFHPKKLRKGIYLVIVGIGVKFLLGL